MSTPSQCPCSNWSLVCGRSTPYPNCRWQRAPAHEFEPKDFGRRRRRHGRVHSHRGSHPRRPAAWRRWRVESSQLREVQRPGHVGHGEREPADVGFRADRHCHGRWYQDQRWGHLRRPEHGRQGVLRRNHSREERRDHSGARRTARDVHGGGDDRPPHARDSSSQLRPCRQSRLGIEQHDRRRPWRYGAAGRLHEGQGYRSAAG